MGCCPTCGQALPSARKVKLQIVGNTVFYNGRTARLRRKHLLILEALNAAYPALVTPSALIEKAWDVHNEPEGVALTLQTYVSQMRKALGPLGLGVRAERYLGYRLEVEKNFSSAEAA